MKGSDGMQSVSSTRGPYVRHRGFESPGRENEHFFLVDAHPDQAFKDQLDQLEREYETALQSRKLAQARDLSLPRLIDGRIEA